MLTNENMRQRPMPWGGSRSGVQHRLHLQRQLRGALASILTTSRGSRPSFVGICRGGDARLHGPPFVSRLETRGLQGTAAAWHGVCSLPPWVKIGTFPTAGECEGAGRNGSNHGSRSQLRVCTLA